MSFFNNIIIPNSGKELFRVNTNPECTECKTGNYQYAFNVSHPNDEISLIRALTFYSDLSEVPLGLKVGDIVELEFQIQNGYTVFRDVKESNKQLRYSQLQVIPKLQSAIINIPDNHVFDFDESDWGIEF